MSDKFSYGATDALQITMMTPTADYAKAMEREVRAADLRGVDRNNLLDAIHRKDWELAFVLFGEFDLPLPGSH
jgi:hypothetical protein